MSGVSISEATFAQSTLYQLLPADARARLREMAKRLDAKKDSTLMRENDEGSTFYIVVNGELSIVVDDISGKKEVARLSAGASVGEMAALLGEPRSATVIAATDVELLTFDGDDVNGLLLEHPTVRQAMVKLALKRSEESVQALRESGES